MKSANRNTFEQYEECAFGLWKITLPELPEDWKSGNCTCPVYLKKLQPVTEHEAVHELVHETEQTAQRNEPPNLDFD